ncbi:MAG: hypothetical protein M1816_000628 [Peltula sp. TS41687]|nr:MAG: hypothetical protein M1816_000628 [Peltula sp. TS41687]
MSRAFISRQPLDFQFCCLAFLIIHGLAITAQAIPFPQVQPVSPAVPSNNSESANPLGSTVINAGTTYKVVCIYPIEGQYGLLPRLLFYALLVFAMIVRTHPWLVAGALAAAMTYAGSAAIHGLVLSQKESSYDYNASAILTILGSSCLIAAPLLSWSSTLRRFKSRPVFLYWLILVSAGFYRQVITALLAEKSMTPVPIDCVSSHTPLESAFLDENFFRSNNCSNPCSYLNDPPVFRHPTGSLPLLYLVSPYTSGVIKFWICFTSLTFPQSLHVLFAGRRAPGHTRNFLFRKLMGPEGEIFTDMRLFGCRLWYLRAALSTLVSLLFYFVVVALTLLCIPALITYTVMEEIALSLLPVSENFSAVGQWAPWTSTGLALFAAVIVRYHDHWISSSRDLIRRSLRLFKAKENMQESANPDPSTPKHGPTTVTWSSTLTIVAPQSCSHRDSLPLRPAVYFSQLLSKVFKPVINGLHRSSRHARNEFDDFVAWFQNPVERSKLSEHELATQRIEGGEKDG